MVGREGQREQSDLSVSQLLQPTKVSNCSQISTALSAILNANPSPRHDDSFKLENVRLLQLDKVGDALPAQLSRGLCKTDSRAEQTRAELSLCSPKEDESLFFSRMLRFR